MNDNGFLVLDTNIWVYSTRLLSIPLGAAVIYSLSRSKRKIALPEIIEEEIKKHTYDEGRKAVEEIQKNYRSIEQLLGSRDNFSVPSDEQFKTRVDFRLVELSEIIYKVEFKLSHARLALKRVLEGTPPNGPKNQQFKDSAIWESILELANEADVDFVTEDKAFFQESNPSKGLAVDLLKDCGKVTGKIRIFYELKKYLETIKQDLPHFDKTKVIHNIIESISYDLSKMAVDKGYNIGSVINKDVLLAFLTEKPKIIAIEFEINYNAFGVLIPETGESTETTLVVKGDCGCDITTYNISDVRFNNIIMHTKDGENIPSYGMQYFYPSCCNIRTIPYQFKHQHDI